MGSLTHRASYVRDRLVAINKSASDIVIENAYLLKEVKDNGLWRTWGYQSFDAAIDDMQAKGMVDYGPRQARNFVAIANMVSERGYTLEQVKEIPISKLREIATIPIADEQKALLDEAPKLTTAEVQKKAKAIRDKAHGREGDPLHPITILVTETGRQMYKDCIQTAREVYSLSDDMPETAVLIDHILADWFTHAIEARRAHGHAPSPA